MPSLVRNPISLEIAHLHAPERLVAMEGYTSGGDRLWNARQGERSLELTAAIEAHIATRPEVAGRAISRLSLLDDVAARDEQRHSLDRWRWELFIGVSRESLERGTAAAVSFESSFVEPAKALCDQVITRARELGLALDADSRITIPTTRGAVRIKIFGFEGVEDRTHPSCAMLDLAWTAWRAGQFDLTYNALPLGYLKQQLQVATLVALLDLPWRDSVTTLFVDRAGRPKGELKYDEVKILRTKDNHEG